ncbi:Urea-proton symporter DUR3 [Dichanthelium oligosanthes]|uniref:Urea-proton symporter DUR3 n=1 Tax=Dichanthelium oligosanthes TaxID=888268 RepID=A0A1E5ULU0_9POAL|nr:Urea-proton symporter DUR3 [Dichanthelium oligosanthes]
MKCIRWSGVAVWHEHASGGAAHVVFLVFCLTTNIIVCDAAAAVRVRDAATGVTFLASYIHSVILHVVFVFLVYASSQSLGSPRAVYDKLMATASAARDCSIPLAHPDQACGPVHGNFKDSLFGITMEMQGYWMSAIAARPSSAHKRYLLGGLLFFALLFSLATSLGLGALALRLPLTTAEAAKGLVPAATATVLMGESGAVLLLIMLFMTVTSAGSAELVAVSSLFTYDDVYRT